MYKILEYIRVLQEKGAIHILVGSFIQKFVAFFGSIFVVRTLSKPEYGLLSYVENIYSYALIFAGLGLSNAMLRYIVLARENEKRAYYNYIIKHSVIRDIVIVMVICVINVFVKYPDDFSAARLWVPVIAFLTIFQDIVNDGLYAIRAAFKNKLFAYLAVGSSVLLIAGRIVGACVYHVGGVVVSRVVLNALIGAAIIPICIKMFPKSTYQLNAAKKKEINAYSIQYMITNGLWAIFMLNDLQMLSMFCADSALVAEYKVAYLLPANISIFATAIGKFTCPYFTKNETNNLWIRDNYKRVYIATAIVVGAVALVMAVLAKPLILIIAGENYISTVPLMRMLLIPSFINSGLRFATADILSSMGQIKFNMIFSIVGMCFQVALNVFLIPGLNVYGVVIANSVAYLIMALGLFIVFIRKYYVK